ncbi:MAG TPA: chorismate mutase [Caulobacteraceae bacterium]|nr:chorismate mutase [Caulobacteraceae bacterium]
MHAKSPSLDAVRARIDEVDAALMKLVDERASLAREVAEAKRAAGETLMLGVRPAREAALIRRLLASPGRAASPQLTVRLWREFISDSLIQQGPFHLAVWGGGDAARTVEVARMRFGAAPPLGVSPSPEGALAEARQPGGVAVLALTSATPWWAELVAEPGLSVFATLPCLESLGPQAALAVANVAVEPTERDETYWVSDAVEPAPRVELALAREGVAARLIAEAKGVRLFGLAGFFPKDDPKLMRAPGALKGVIGASPTPFDI